MKATDLDTLKSLYQQFEIARQDIVQNLQRMAGVNIERMTLIENIGDDPVEFECVRNSFKIDKKVFLVDKNERENMCADAVRRWRAEIKAEEDELERGRERNRIEEEKRKEQREFELYQKLKKKFDNSTGGYSA